MSDHRHCTLLATFRKGSVWLPRGDLAPDSIDARGVALATYRYVDDELARNKVPFADPPADWGLYSAGGMISMSGADFFWETWAPEDEEVGGEWPNGHMGPNHNLINMQSCPSRSRRAGTSSSTRFCPSRWRTTASSCCTCRCCRRTAS